MFLVERILQKLDACVQNVKDHKIITCGTTVRELLVGKKIPSRGDSKLNNYICLVVYKHTNKLNFQFFFFLYTRYSRFAHHLNSTKGWCSSALSRPPKFVWLKCNGCGSGSSSPSRSPQDDR